MTEKQKPYFALLVNPYAEGVRARIKEIGPNEPEDWHLFIGRDERVHGEFESRELAESAKAEYLRAAC